MTQDNEQVVQPEGQASAVEQVSQEQEGQKPPEPSPEEKMGQLIEQKVAEEVAKATETSRREIQSVKDKAQRRSRLPFDGQRWQRPH